VIRGLEYSAQILTPASRAQEIMANSLANSATPGFLAERFTFSREGEETIVRGTLDLTPGAIEETSNPLDVALQSGGFFVVQTDDGPAYTRDGSFRLDGEGTLIHSSGAKVQTDAGEIIVPPNSSVTITADGEVRANGASLGKFRVVEFDDPSTLRHLGQNLIGAEAEPLDVEAPRVSQGSLESANVEPVRAMVDMIGIQRLFEANQSALLTQDGSLGRLIQWASR